MKDLKDIENISLEQLEEIAADGRIPVPADLESGIRSAISASERKKRLFRYPAIVSAAACFAVLAVVGTLYLSKPSVDLYAEPEDTFTDPMLAYAALESALGRIGSTVGENMEKTVAFDQTMEKAARAIK